MKNIFQKKTSRLILIVFAFSLMIIPLSTCPPDSFGGEELPQPGTVHSEDYNPLIVYYSRSGNSRIVADTLIEQLAFPVEEIQSTKNREGFLGVFTCVLDQLLDRDDIQEPLQKDPKDFNPVILVTPVWIGKLASPARTYIKQPAVVEATRKGREDASAEYAHLKEIEDDIRVLWAGRASTKRVTRKNVYWGRRIPLLYRYQ